MTREGIVRVPKTTVHQAQGEETVTREEERRLVETQSPPPKPISVLGHDWPN